MGSLRLGPRFALGALIAGFAAAAMQWVFFPEQGRAAGVALAICLAWASAVDIDRRILPDAITLGLLLAGLGLAWLEGPEATFHRVVGAATGYGSLALVAALYRRFRGREGLGAGDAKLAGAAGAWLGWAALPLVMLAASVSALLYVGGRAALGRRIADGEAIPFGPFIAAGFWTLWLLGGTAGSFHLPA